MTVTNGAKRQTLVTVCIFGGSASLAPARILLCSFNFFSMCCCLLSKKISGPSLTQHLVRFGIYHIDHTRRPKPLTYQVFFDSEKAQEEKEEGNERMSGA